MTILKKRWRLRFVPNLGNKRGDCDGPEEKNKEIRIRLRLPPQETLEILIHEMLHAADWTKDEKWVETVSDDISRALWRLGYRRTTVEDEPA